VEQDLRAGLPSFIVAERHKDCLFVPSPLNELTQKEKDLWAETLRGLHRVGLGPFRFMREDPAFRMTSLPVVPAAMNHMQQDGGNFQGFSDEANLLFTLPRRQFVYAIRLKYSYNVDAITSPASMQLLWKRRGEIFSRSERNFSLRLETQPGDKTGTIWVNDTIDQFCIYPILQPCVFHLEAIVLLVPTNSKPPASY
jgi:hypothetical protein